MKIWLLIHRYLGIALGVLMVVWCLSGIVMMYVPYPYLSEADRIAHVPPIDWRSCCTLPETGPWSGFEVETIGTRTVLRVRSEHGRSRLFDLTNGTALEAVSESEATAVAGEFGDSHRARLLDVIDHDQWTVQGSHGWDRPLFHFSLDDSGGTEVYVSSVSGKALQVTNARQRLWNWLGAVPHWIYFSSLRQYPDAWSQVVVWTSLLGTFLCLTGLYIGIRHLRPRRSAGWIPYRGLHYWHHLLGLVCGVFLLTWVFSGLVSMNPWGFLEGGIALIRTEDEYYFSHHRELVSLPAYRIILDDAQQTRYYLDPVSGQALSVVDSNGRWYRWLHQALHRIDFSAAVRASPTRDVFMVTALVGMALVCALGTYLGLRR